MILPPITPGDENDDDLFEDIPGYEAAKPQASATTKPEPEPQPARGQAVVETTPSPLPPQREEGEPDTVEVEAPAPEKNPDTLTGLADPPGLYSVPIPEPQLCPECGEMVMDSEEGSYCPNGHDVTSVDPFGGVDPFGDEDSPFDRESPADHVISEEEDPLGPPLPEEEDPVGPPLPDQEELAPEPTPEKQQRKKVAGVGMVPSIPAEDLREGDVIVFATNDKQRVTAVEEGKGGVVIIRTDDEKGATYEHRKRPRTQTPIEMPRPEPGEGTTTDPADPDGEDTPQKEVEAAVPSKVEEGIEIPDLPEVRTPVLAPEKLTLSQIGNTVQAAIFDLIRTRIDPPKAVQSIDQYFATFTPEKMEGVLQQLMEEEEGFPAELEAHFRKLGIKVEHVAAYIRVLEQMDGIAAQEAARLNKRRKTLSREADWLRNYIREWMERLGMKSIKGATHHISVVPIQDAVVVLNQDEVPTDYVKTKTVTTTSVDKVAVLKHFRETGEILPGVEILVERHTIRIS